MRLSWQHEEEHAHAGHDGRPGDETLAGFHTGVYGFQDGLRRLPDRDVSQR